MHEGREEQEWFENSRKSTKSILCEQQRAGLPVVIWYGQSHVPNRVYILRKSKKRITKRDSITKGQM